MKQLIRLLFVLPVLLLTSCSKEEMAEDTQGVQGNITFAIDFAPQTRVGTGADFTSGWEDGDQIGLFAVAHDGTGGTLAASGNYITNVELTYNRAAGTWTPSEPLYWPGSGKVLSFYAYHPYLGGGGFNPTALAFGVLTDQNGTIGYKSNYNHCDLITAKSDNAGNGWGKGSTVPLVFNHALAMMQVSIPSDGKGFGPSENLKVTLRGVKPGGTLNLANISATAGSEITLPVAGNDPVDITMHRVEQPADGNYETAYTYRALVPAQTVAAGSSLFWFEHEGRQLLMDGALATPLIMNAGQAETFTRMLPAAVVHTVPVAKGTFLMGSSDGSNLNNMDGSGLNTTPVESGRNSDETQHSVTLTKGFRMSKYQITNAQYAAFLNDAGIGDNGAGDVTYHDNTTVTESKTLISTHPWGVVWNTNQWVAQTGYENHPVVRVTWFGAKAYADWAGGALPTEAQWEYACRGGTTTAFYFGDDYNLINDYGWFYYNSFDSTNAVGLKKPNDYGLYDMHGNVWEWCSDWYTENFGSANASDPATDPTGPINSASGNNRVHRGGCYNSSDWNCRSAKRFRANSGSIVNYLGFRVVFIP